VLLVLGWVAILPKGDLALWEHGLMMPVMLIPMLFRMDVYTGRAGHAMHGHIAAQPSVHSEMAGDARRRSAGSSAPSPRSR
jgi:hypothetical protein